MRLGTIGTSLITNKFVDAFCSIEGNSYEAVYSRALSNAQNFQNKKGARKAYDNIENMLNDPNVDIVYIASPNILHFQHSKEALKKGKHVLCEKPIAVSSEEMDELEKIANEYNCFIFETITTIHMPNFNKLKDKIGDIGKVKMVRSDLSQFSKKYNEYKSGIIRNVFNPVMNGGALLDLGVYCIHLVVGLFGAPDSVSYKANKGINGIDTSGVLILEYPDMLAILTFGKDSYSCNETFIQGDRGYIKIMGPPSRLNELEVQIDDTSSNIVEQIRDNHLIYEAMNFTNIINSNNKAIAYELWNHSRNVAKVIEIVRKVFKKGI